MNPQIRELAEQAGWMMSEEVEGFNTRLERFARLIVEQCLCKIELEAAQYHEPAWAVELVNDIKDHFGVSE